MATRPTLPRGHGSATPSRRGARVMPPLAWAFLCALFWAPTAPANAQGIDVTPTIPNPAVPVLDLQNENCRGTQGFGLLTYGTGSLSHHLADVCFVEASGLAVAGEVLRNLTLAGDGPNGRRYEDLSMGSDQYDRNAISFFPDANAPGCVNGLETIEMVSHTATGYDGYSGQGFGGFAYLVGYTLPVLAAHPPMAATEVLVGIRDSVHAQTGEPLDLFGDFYAQGDFSGQSGRLSGLVGGGYVFGTSGGEFAIEFDGLGGFRMSGLFETQSQRIAGHRNDEMVQLSGQVAHFRGHVIGENGQQLLGFGSSFGTFITSSGEAVPFRASMYLIACFD